MIVTGASLLGQVLASRASPGFAPAVSSSPASRDPAPDVATPTVASVTMSPSILSALLDLRSSSRASPDAGTRDEAASSDRPRAGFRTTVDPGLVRETMAVLEGRGAAGATAGRDGVARLLDLLAASRMTGTDARATAGQAPGSVFDLLDRAVAH
ncbi:MULTISPECIES: hypothetical protein [Methylobacterium]|uniref:Uncharacterized protein n=2 Tax=Methylobacterium TaxID=407 RepID=A0A0C6FJS1_9HYPH|nr:hypothetical protein [Methylobacterium aquaticum]BAQ48728.1 hypothetical protein Maq22A_1p32030 [Methylobacterium aquaticum]